MNAPAAPAGVQTSELPLDRIVPSNTHIQLMRRERFNAQLLRDLAKSIAEIGVLQPIVVRPTDTALYELVAGERRWLAAKIAGLAAIPATVRELTDEQVLKAQLVENLQRDGLHELEEAEGYGELMKLEKITADQVAEMVGKSRSYVFARLKLLALGPEARKAFYAGEIDASRALYIARIANPKLQVKALALATEKGWKGELQYSVRSLREKLTGNGFSIKLHTAPFARDDASFVERVRVKKGVDEERALPDCVSCPNRTGNCLDLFSQGDDPDVCMDPACYEAKIRQHGERERARAEAAGVKVLTGEDAKKIAPRKGELAGYVDLDEPCEEDELDEDQPDYPETDDEAAEAAYEKAMDEWNERYEAHQPRTFRQLLQGAELTPVVIEDPRDHRIRTLVPYKQAEKALKKAHKIDLSPWKHGMRSGSETAGETAEEKAARLKKEEAQRARQEQEAAFRKALLQAVAAKAAVPLKRDDLELVATAMLEDWDIGNAAEEFYGKKPQPGQMKETELLALVRVLTVIQCLSVHTSPAPLLDLARRLKVDPDKIKKDLKAAEKTKEESPKKPVAKKAKKS